MCAVTEKIAHVNELVVFGRAWDSGSEEDEAHATQKRCSPYTTCRPPSALLIRHPT